MVHTVRLLVGVKGTEPVIAVLKRTHQVMDVLAKRNQL
uniref:Uncharacterized protein n=1 Tax=Yersinia enterocolitica W22703 TaxID=913028 RepID=F4N1L2_YEREN|nr:unknown protein [Yersinia enterocolitica W22703]